MNSFRQIVSYIDQPNLLFSGCLAALIFFSFFGSVRRIRFSLAWISVLNFLIAAGISFAVPDYLAVDYYAVSFFVMISVVGFASSLFIKSSAWMLRAVLIVICGILIALILYSKLFAKGGLYGEFFVPWPFEARILGYYATGTLLSALILFTAGYSLRAPGQRKERLFKSIAISVFVFWTVFVCYPFFPARIPVRIYNSYAFDNITRNFFFGFEVDSINRRFETRLHLAAENGDLVKIKSLLKAGANPYAETRTGNYRLPLHYAAKANNLASFKLILDSMDNVDFRDADGKSLVHIAALGDNSEFLEYVMRREPSVDSIRAPDSLLHLAPIHVAATSRGSTRDNVKKNQILLRAGANINSEDGIGFTPLYFAVISANVGVVKEFLKNGADTNKTYIKDKTILQVALEEKQKCETRCRFYMDDPVVVVKKLTEIINILERHISQRE